MTFLPKFIKFHNEYVSSSFAPKIPESLKETRLTEMFPEYDVGAILQRFPQKSAEQIADWIVSNKNAPKMKPLVPPHFDEFLRSEPDYSDDSDVKELIFLAMFRELSGHYKKKKTERYSSNYDRITNQIYADLTRMFPDIDGKFLEQAYHHRNDVLSTVIAIWFVSHDLKYMFAHLVGDYDSASIFHTQNGIKKWDPQNPKFQNVLKGFANTSPVASAVKIFQKHLIVLIQKYPTIFKNQSLIPVSMLNRDILFNRTFGCQVCYDRQNIGKKLECGSESDANRHWFCRKCLRRHAIAATQEMPLAEGAVGFKCMHYGCRNPIYYSAVRLLLSKPVRRQIEARIVQQNLTASGLQLERCNHCNYAVEMSTTADKQQVFKCPECKSMKCRKCQKKFDAAHVGVKCSPKNNGYSRKNHKNRILEAEMSEILIRKCSNCGLQFLKSDGCNTMHCRCGATHCYVCKEQNIKNNHFCNHARDPNQLKCSQCSRCNLWEDISKKEELQIQHLRTKFEKESNTFASAPTNWFLHLFHLIANFFSSLFN